MSAKRSKALICYRPLLPHVLLCDVPPPAAVHDTKTLSDASPIANLKWGMAKVSTGLKISANGVVKGMAGDVRRG